MRCLELCIHRFPGTGILLGWSLLASMLLAGSVPMKGNENVVRVTIKQSGTSITLHSGEVLEVALPATFGTGYSWKIASVPANILRSEGKPETLAEHDGASTGQTETQLFRFVASGNGKGELELQYVRPWEKQLKPAKVFSLAVAVQ